MAGPSTQHDGHGVVYRGNDGHLYELWWAGTNPVNYWDLTAISHAPFAVSDPAVYYGAGTDTRHVIYRSADNHLHEIWWVPGGGTPAHVDLHLYVPAPPATDRPAAFTVGDPNSQHVIYRGTDNQIYETYWIQPRTNVGTQRRW